MTYKEIFRLKIMLDEAGIKKEVRPYAGGFQMRLNSRIDVIECPCSYGNDKDLLEIYGIVWGKQGAGAVGDLTAEEVFKIFKYCYEHDTNTYWGDVHCYEEHPACKENDIEPRDMIELPCKEHRVNDYGDVWDVYYRDERYGFVRHECRGTEAEADAFLAELKGDKE